MLSAIRPCLSSRDFARWKQRRTKGMSADDGGSAKPCCPLLDALTALDEKSLRRCRRTLDSAQSAHVTVDVKPYVAFCSNDYLGLANHPALIAAAQAGAAQYGVGAGASHLVLGHGRAHEALEHDLATFAGLPRALLFSTGYMANLGVI